MVKAKDISDVDYHLANAKAQAIAKDLELVGVLFLMEKGIIKHRFNFKEEI